MTPSALLGKLVGTDWAIASGRLLTVIAGTASVTLGGLLARHRGVFAVLVACGLPAVFPDSIQAAHTVLVEPWLALFCLAGALAVFEGDRLTASHRRLVWGGVAFGFAGAVEVWAVFPLAVIAVLSLRAPRRLARYPGRGGCRLPGPGAAVGYHRAARLVPGTGRRPGRRQVPPETSPELVPREGDGGALRFPCHPRHPADCRGGDRGVRDRGAQPGLLGHTAPADGAGVVRIASTDPGGCRVHVAQPVPLPLPRVPGAVPRAGHSAANGPAHGGRPAGRDAGSAGTGIAAGMPARLGRGSRPGCRLGRDADRGGTQARPGGGRPRPGCSGPRPGWPAWRSSP